MDFSYSAFITAEMKGLIDRREPPMTKQVAAPAVFKADS